MLGNATFTIETSRTTMNCAMQAIVRTIQSGASRCALVEPSSVSDFDIFES